jgi:hypothetical protein
MSSGTPIADARKVIGTAIVKQIFPSGTQSVAGCYVSQGLLRTHELVRIFREGASIHNGVICSMRRLRQPAEVVSSGEECGLLLEKSDTFAGLQVGDSIECYELQGVPMNEQELSAHQRAFENAVGPNNILRAIQALPRREFHQLLEETALNAREHSLEVRAAALRHMENPSAALLTKIALNDAELGWMAVSLISDPDPKLLAEIAERSPNALARQHAAESLKDPAMLTGVLVRSTDSRVRQIAVESVVDSETLEAASCSDPELAVRRAANKRIVALLGANCSACRGTGEGAYGGTLSGGRRWSRPCTSCGGVGRAVVLGTAKAEQVIRLTCKCSVLRGELNISDSRYVVEVLSDQRIVLSTGNVSARPSLWKLERLNGRYSVTIKLLEDVCVFADLRSLYVSDKLFGTHRCVELTRDHEEGPGFLKEFEVLSDAQLEALRLQDDELRQRKASLNPANDVTQVSPSTVDPPTVSSNVALSASQSESDPKSGHKSEGMRSWWERFWH